MKLKHIGLTSLLTLSVFTAVLYTSCSKDSCNNVQCENGGSCSSGSCTCPSGYSGNNCETAWSAPYVGTWNVTESCGGIGSTPYQVTIISDPANPTHLTVSNLGNYNCVVSGANTNIQYSATMTTPTTFTISDNQCNTQMNATGTLNTGNGQLTITYTASYNGTTDNCTATLTK